MKRSELRENVFRLIFMLQNNGELNEESLEYYFKDNEIEEKDAKYIKDKVNNIALNLEKIDSIIEENSHKYTLSRLSAVSLSVLRLAIYEITFEEDIPNGVAASEAIKLSQKYDDENAKGYINGILGAYIRKSEA